MVATGNVLISPGLNPYSKFYEFLARTSLPRVGLRGVGTVIALDDGARLDEYGLPGSIIYTPGHSAATSRCCSTTAPRLSATPCRAAASPVSPGPSCPTWRSTSTTSWPAGGPARRRRDDHLPRARQRDPGEELRPVLERNSLAEKPLPDQRSRPRLYAAAHACHTLPEVRREMKRIPGAPDGAIPIAGSTLYVPGLTNSGYVDGLVIDTGPTSPSTSSPRRTGSRSRTGMPTTSRAAPTCASVARPSWPRVTTPRWSRTPTSTSAACSRGPSPATSW